MNANNILGAVFISIFTSTPIVGTLSAPDNPVDFCQERLNESGVADCIKNFTPESYSELKSQVLLIGVLLTICVWFGFFVKDHIESTRISIRKDALGIKYGSENQ